MSQSFDSLEAPLERLGISTFSHKDNAAADVRFDRIAHDGNKLQMIALVVEPMRAKAIRSILYAKQGKPMITAKGVPSRFPSAGDLAQNEPGDLVPDDGGYETYMHRLDYGMVHCVFVTRNANFIQHLSPESLWLRLNSDLFSTPLIQEWMTYLAQELIARNHLRECRCYRANCGVLDIKNDGQLDEIVSDGIRNGKIHIP